MRRSGKITAAVLVELMQAARPGITTVALDEQAERGIRSRGGVPTFKGYRGYVASLCASVNDEVVHGISGERGAVRWGLAVVGSGDDARRVCER